MRDRLSVYVSSFDAYSDILPYFFARFFKYWPDCPYQIQLGGISKNYKHSRVRTIKTAPGQDWSSAAIDCIKRIKQPYVLMLLDDFLLDQPVQNKAVSQVLEYMERLNLHAVRLFPCPPPDLPMPAIPGLGFQAESQPNRISTHATLWRRATLLELMRPGENIWEFEIYGTIRSNRFPGGICSSWRPRVHYVMAIDKGRWVRRALRSLAKDKIYPDIRDRPVETRWQEISNLVRNQAANAVRAVLPLRLRQWLRTRVTPSVYKY